MSEEKDASIAVVSTQIAGLKELMLEKIAAQDTVLGVIKEQTMKTNGHVADAFLKIEALNDWKNKIAGGLIVSNIIIVPIVLYLLYQRLNS